MSLLLHPYPPTNHRMCDQWMMAGLQGVPENQLYSNKSVPMAWDISGEIDCLSVSKASPVCPLISSFRVLCCLSAAIYNLLTSEAIQVHVSVACNYLCVVILCRLFIKSFYMYYTCVSFSPCVSHGSHMI